jgi:hypothetical protein
MTSFILDGTNTPGLAPVMAAARCHRGEAPFCDTPLLAAGSVHLLNVYKVMKPIDVDAGPAAPWFGQPGGGTQYELPATIKELVASGHLKPI